MRVLQFSGWVDPAGRDPESLLEAWPSLTGVAQAVQSAGVEVEVLQAARRDAVIEAGGVPFRFVRERCSLLPARLRGSRAVLYPARSLAVAARRRVDVVHVHGLASPFQIRRLARALGPTPVLAQDHANVVPPGWRRPVHRWGLAPLAGVAFTARAQAEPFFHAGLFRPGLPVFEVLEASTHFRPRDRQAARAETGVHGSPGVLWVGDLSSHKDPLTALSAVEAVQLDLPDLHLWMVFRGRALVAEVEAWLGARPEVRDRIHLVGAVPHGTMQWYLSAADLFLSTSHREGSGYTLIEALACGTPVVVSGIPSHERIVRRLGLRPAAPGSTQAFAAGLRAWSPDATEERRRAVRRHFEASLSWARVGEDLLEAYRALHRRARGVRSKS